MHSHEYEHFAESVKRAEFGLVLFLGFGIPIYGSVMHTSTDVQLAISDRGSAWGSVLTIKTN
jgi:hypothetical protein